MRCSTTCRRCLASAQLTVELAAVVGLDRDLGQFDPMASEVLQEPADAGTRMGLGYLVGEGHKQKARAHVADGVLVFGKAQKAHLRQVGGDVVEVFDVHADGLEGAAVSSSPGGQHQPRTSLIGSGRFLTFRNRSDTLACDTC